MFAFFNSIPLGNPAPTSPTARTCPRICVYFSPSLSAPSGMSCNLTAVLSNTLWLLWNVSLDADTSLSFSVWMYPCTYRRNPTCACTPWSWFTFMPEVFVNSQCQICADSIDCWVSLANASLYLMALQKSSDHLSSQQIDATSCLIFSCKHWRIIRWVRTYIHTCLYLYIHMYAYIYILCMHICMHI